MTQLGLVSVCLIRGGGGGIPLLFTTLEKSWFKWYNYWHYLPREWGELESIFAGCMLLASQKPSPIIACSVV